MGELNRIRCLALRRSAINIADKQSSKFTGPQESFDRVHKIPFECFPKYISTIIIAPTVQVNNALSRVDKMMESLFAGLKQRGVGECVNIIIISDHGMTAYNFNKFVDFKKVSMYIYSDPDTQGLFASL